MTQIKLKKTNHFIHAILTLFTCALWAIPWVLITNANNRHNDMLRASGAIASGEKKEDEKIWTFGNVFSAWMSTIFISFVAFMVSGGDETITLVTAAVLAVMAVSITVEFIMKKKSF